MPTMKRSRDAEAELNLPPGFRFHPTDEELVVHYLYQKISCHCLPVPIIAEVDLYKYDPWELPEKALFGQKEWYFFTPRDRKYPNGSRPNRAAGQGYWKATGADKPVTPKGSNKALGIKKALVFYSGKAPRGVKTDWIMHEYRIAEVNRSFKKGSLRLDEWVLCRLYNKKNTWEKMQQQGGASSGEPMNSADDTGSVGLGTPESDAEQDNGLPNFEELTAQLGSEPSRAYGGVQTANTGGTVGVQKVEQFQKEDNDWFAGLNLEDFQNFQHFQNGHVNFVSGQSVDTGNQDYYFQYFLPSMLKTSQAMPPF